jgi:hypothetical protein
VRALALIWAVLFLLLVAVLLLPLALALTRAWGAP